MKKNNKVIMIQKKVPISVGKSCTMTAYHMLLKERQKQIMDYYANIEKNENINWIEYDPK